jgi:Protein of unknown function (DUF2892)
MVANIGYMDRIIRFVVGLALIALALGYIPGMSPQIWGWIGVVPLVTALFGVCPAYKLLGFNTCSRV